MRNTVGILGIPIDKLNTEEAMERMEYFITTRRFHQVATANTNFLVNALFDPELRHILRVCDMVVPDGMLVVRAAGVLKSRLEERVTGADIVPRMAKRAAQRGYRIFMLGGKPENAVRAQEQMLKDYPGLNIVGCLSPNIKSILNKESNEPILDAIAEAKPDVLLVAFGNPKQEKWIHVHRERLAQIPVPVCIGVGGTFDFLSGAIPRAPRWMQEAGLEFFWRFMMDPWRLGKRYSHDFYHFLPSFVRQYRAVHAPPSLDKPEVEVTPVIADSVIFTIGGHFDRALADQFATLAEQAIRDEKHLILDFKKGTTFDADGIGVLIMLPKRAAYTGRQVYLVTPPFDVRARLRRSQLDESLFEMFHNVNTITEALRGENRARPWVVEPQNDRTIVTLQNNSTNGHLALMRMATDCVNMLQNGSDLDLDVRSLKTADSFLLLTLRQLHEAAHARNGSGEGESAPLRIVPGEALLQRLHAEEMTQEFHLIAPEVLGARYAPGSGNGKNAPQDSLPKDRGEPGEEVLPKDETEASKDKDSLAMYRPAAL